MSLRAKCSRVEHRQTFSAMLLTWRPRKKSSSRPLACPSASSFSNSSPAKMIAGCNGSGRNQMESHEEALKSFVASVHINARLLKWSQLSQIVPTIRA